MASNGSQGSTSSPPESSIITSRVLGKTTQFAAGAIAAGMLAILCKTNGGAIGKKPE